MTEPEAAPELTPLDAEDEEALISALAAAWRPSELDARRLEQIIEIALEDPLAAPTRDEVVESERLRRALEGEGTHPEAALADALRAAAKNADAALVERAIARASQAPKTTKGGAGGSRGNVVFAVFGGAAAALALAAAVALWLVPSGDREPAQAAAPAASASPASGLALSRSTAPLFPERFETAATTARIDRISAVRMRELRENRYSRWGVP